MKNKKGSHIGMILSVVIFVGFLIFLFVVLNPSIMKIDNERSIVDSIDLKLKEQFEDSMTVLTISTSEESFSCWNIPDSALEIGSNNFYVKSLNDEPISAELNGGYLSINNGSFDRIKVFYSSSQFNSLEGENCSGTINTDYNIDSSRTTQYYFEDKILNMINYTNENYKEMKELLEIPLDREFGFGFVYENGTKIETDMVLNPENIYVSERSISYIDKNARLSSGILRIKTWR